jgi:hypothetical protein
VRKEVDDDSIVARTLIFINTNERKTCGALRAFVSAELENAKSSADSVFPDFCKISIL